MKQDPAVIEAQNKRKIEKDKRRKYYHDLQVQGTNNSSIVSKRSVEMIYNPVMDPQSKEWFKHFVPKAKRRSPAINRGYWVRMESIKQMVLRILREYPSQNIRVVNLGCGFDPLPFQLLSEYKGILFQFLDFDYPELVQRKLDMIKDSPEILEVIGDKIEIPNMSDLGVIMSTSSYTLVGCDLKDTEKYNKQLNELLVGPGPTIFIAEVSLAYMKPEHANPVIEILSRVSDCHFLVLEQIMPSGPDHFFAQKMLYHFDHLRSPLQCVTEYSTKEKQRQRFQCFFPNVTIVDMFESWEQLVLPERKAQIASVEDFDEWEEFIVFCQHYVLIHATNSSHIELKELPMERILPNTSGIDMHLVLFDTPIELKFPAASEGSDGVYVHGGMWQTRNDELLCIRDSLARVDVLEKPSPRMCHTLTDLEDGRLLLIGGRSRPGHNFHDIWLFKKDLRCWANIGSIENIELSRHNAVCISKSTVLVLADGKFVTLTVDSNDILKVFNIECEDFIPKVRSCGFSFNAEENVGYIAGGMIDNMVPTFSRTVYEFRLRDNKITIQPIISTDSIARIGCALHQENGKLYIVGGVGTQLTNQENTIVCMDTNKTIYAVPIQDETWKTFPVLIGFRLTNSTIVGGGAVCYSFGSVYNPTYRVRFS